jgi:glyoxylase-like metal-dependent hydrolase (beta-lactamase superfamily II)
MATPIDASTAPVPLDRRLVAARSRGPDEARAYRIDAGFWSLRVPLPYPRTRAVNCYLLDGTDGCTLVDCGSAVGAGWSCLARALELAGVDPRAVTALVLTHLHPDHASLAAEVVQRLGCALLRHAGPDTADDRLREPVLALEARRRAARAEGVPARDLDGIVDTPLAGDGVQGRPPADRILVAGDVLQTRAGTWEVLPAPGHSPQQMALVDRRGRRLISADMAYARIRPFLEWGHTPDPVSEYLRTIDRAERCSPTLVLPGHGRPDPAPRERFASARAALAALIERVDRALGDAPSSGYDVTCRITGRDPDPDLRQSWLSCALCALEHLQARGRLTAEVADDGVRRFART